MVDDISAGPIQVCNESAPTYDELQGSAELAQTIAAAMDRLHKQRSATALDALAGLLPNPAVRAVHTNKQKATLALTPRIRHFTASRAKLKAQRCRGHPLQSAAVRQNNQNCLTPIQSDRFAGKSPAAVAAERDQLAAQARTRFAKDPKTQAAVINVLNNEAAKHRNFALAATPAQAGQSAVLAHMMQLQGQTMMSSAAAASAQAPRSCRLRGGRRMAGSRSLQLAFNRRRPPLPLSKRRR